MKFRKFTSRILACLLLNIAGVIIGSLPVYTLAMAAEDGHMHHHHPGARMQKLSITRANYAVPDLSFQSQENQAIRFSSLFEGEPVIVNFIFTSCKAICPIQTSTFAQLQGILARQHIKARLVSISIDPETDTPRQLAVYAQKFHAAPNWLFLTGSKTDSIRIQKAFDAFRGPKMNHIPLTLIKQDQDTAWLRIEGFASAQEVAAQLAKQISN
jgi:protein SCO1/2